MQPEQSAPELTKGLLLHRNHSHPFILETMETDSEIQESCQGRMGWSKGDGACTEDEERIERDISELVRQAAPKAAGRRTRGMEGVTSLLFTPEVHRGFSPGFTFWGFNSRCPTDQRPFQDIFWMSYFCNSANVAMAKR